MDSNDHNWKLQGIYINRTSVLQLGWGRWEGLIMRRTQSRRNDWVRVGLFDIKPCAKQRVEDPLVCPKELEVIPYKGGEKNFGIVAHAPMPRHIRDLPAHSFKFCSMAAGHPNRQRRMSISIT